MPPFAAALLKRFAAAATEPHFADTQLVLPDDEQPRGCGWFDSSHELKAGLDVMEHASADAVASQMPLADWLAMHLAGWQADAAAA
jgi:hypothetical protein